MVSGLSTIFSVFNVFLFDSFIQYFYDYIVVFSYPLIKNVLFI